LDLFGQLFTVATDNHNICPAAKYSNTRCLHCTPHYALSECLQSDQKLSQRHALFTACPYREHPDDPRPPIFDDLTALEVVNELCHQLEAFWHNEPVKDGNPLLWWLFLR
jgi:hypothetical protein